MLILVLLFAKNWLNNTQNEMKIAKVREVTDRRRIGTRIFTKFLIMSSLTHWHTQTSLRRPGSLGPLTLRLLMSYIYIYIWSAYS